MEKYTKLRLLGKGSFGTVYKVRNNTTNKEYAMKVIQVGKAEEFKKKIELMKMATSLSNPHVVKYIESFENEIKLEYSVIMEYCVGGNLRTVINGYKAKGERIPDETVIKYMTQILLGVNYIHNKQILHMNLKPENLLIDDEGDVKINDFGIAKQLTSKLACEESTLGTMCYSSLEVLEGKSYSFDADIWSLGCIFHELCCLEPPFNGSTPIELFTKLGAKKYDSSLIPKEYNVAIKNIIASILNFESKERPSCEELLKNELLKKYKEESEKICKKVEDYENGDSYDGEFRSNKRHGTGIYYHVNGDKYNGNWKANKKHGPGIYTYADGSSYEGDFVDDKRSGEGIFNFANGDKYKGEWRNNKKHGKGILYFANGDRFEGEWKDDECSSRTVFYYTNGDRYEGDCKNGKRHGNGTMHFADGVRYEGEWKKGKEKGKGTRYYANGDKYEGQWKDGKRQGKGVYYFKDGERYEGDWKDDIKEGRGVLYLSDDEKYEGEWRNDKRNGKGVLYYSNGDKYDGDWKDDKKHGKGVYYWIDGKKYNGDWENNKRNGEGVYIYEDGDNYKGEWKNGKRHGKGVCYYGNGNKYEGEWDNDVENGMGKLTTFTGAEYVGNWKDGKMSNSVFLMGSLNPVNAVRNITGIIGGIFK